MVGPSKKLLSVQARLRGYAALRWDSPLNPGFRWPASPFHSVSERSRYFSVTISRMVGPTSCAIRHDTSTRTLRADDRARPAHLLML